MKIAFFVWEYWPRLVGGLGTYAIEITKKFKEMGHEVTVFTLNDGTLKTLEEWDGIEIHRPMLVDSSKVFPIFVREDLKRWGTHIKFFSDIFSYNYLSASKFVNLLVKRKKEKFDVVAFHDWLAAFAGAIIEKEIPSLPTVFHVHSIEEQRALGGGSQVIKEIEREAARDADSMITVSYSMKDFLVSLGYPKEKINVCYNGCDPEKYNPKKVDPRKVEELKKLYGIKPEEKVIFFIGRLTAVKGVYNLVNAMPLVLEEFPQVKLVILGKGEQYQDLITFVQQHNIGNKVIIRSEWVSEEERILHYAMADVCVFPSLSEPFGIVSLEAMAMEKPVVVGASGVSGLREQVIPSGPNRTGVHVDGNKPEDIAWGIKEVLRNFEEAKKWGKNGRKRVLKEFTWEKAAKRTLAIYEKLIK
ncbi:MAG TPA: glycosyltransferase family 1 protein [Candidatus Aenigmarchaeota archaeon]|nr:glycosyltransferase family 1 protein [Candidatus Aenigmarchaeota archaeon]